VKEEKWMGITAEFISHDALIIIFLYNPPWNSRWYKPSLTNNQMEKSK
jgi:hypothetical protein